MKLFDGINKYTYQTIFGKIQLAKVDNEIRLVQFDEPTIAHARLQSADIFRLARFDNRIAAYKKLKKLESTAIADMQQLLSEVT